MENSFSSYTNSIDESFNSFQNQKFKELIDDLNSQGEAKLSECKNEIDKLETALKKTNEINLHLMVNKTYVKKRTQIFLFRKKMRN